MQYTQMCLCIATLVKIKQNNIRFHVFQVQMVNTLNITKLAYCIKNYVFTFFPQRLFVCKVSQLGTDEVK